MRSFSVQNESAEVKATLKLVFFLLQDRRVKYQDNEYCKAKKTKRSDLNLTEQMSATEYTAKHKTLLSILVYFLVQIS